MDYLKCPKFSFRKHNLLICGPVLQLSSFPHTEDFYACENSYIFGLLQLKL